MGLAMATNMQKHMSASKLPPLRYWNRTISRGGPLRDIGGVPAASVEELVKSCDIIFISVMHPPSHLQTQSKYLINEQLSDDTAVQNLTETIASSSPLSGKIFIDTTTIHPNTTTSLTQSFTSHNVTYLSAPVFGSTPVATSGQLLIAIAGPSDAIEIVSPFLKGVLARNVIIVGQEPSQAMLLKTTSNYVTAGLMYLLSEAHVFAEISGLPAEILHELVEQNLGTYAGGVSERLMSGAYCPGEGEAPRSGLELGIKDVGHGVSCAREKGVRLRVGEMYLDAAGEAKEWGDERGRKLDSSSVFGTVRRRGGLEFESGVVKQREVRESN